MSSSPREQALASIRDYTAAPTGRVEYQSRGKVLIIGGSDALMSATQLHASLQAHVVLTEDSGLAHGQSVITLQQGRTLKLDGWLGAFRLTLTDAGGTQTELSADLVLDLHTPPLHSRQIQAPGYFSLPEVRREQELPAVLEQLADLTGTFAKPKYFEYNPDTCAHSRSGLPGCTRCIDACPAEAIISMGSNIRVEPHLCQGGGTCATVCPTGAIRYNYPPPSHPIDQTRRMLRTWHEANGGTVTVLFYRAELTPELQQLPEHILPFPVEELASIGAEVWTAVLSFGANRVLLLDDEATPPLSRHYLQQQMSIARTLLTAMGYPAEALSLVTQIPTEPPTEQGMPPLKAATQSGMNNKRQQWMLALDHLHAQAPQQPADIPLPPGAPFGRLHINKETCTLCMACATICPAQALSGGIESPQVRFFSQNCVQCGLCSIGCPEQSITLEPVYLTSREQRQKPLLLNEERPFHCISCGKPFASLSIITKMLGKLQGHYMFQDERARKRLEMCENCRVIDIVQDEDAMGRPDTGDKVTKTFLH